MAISAATLREHGDALNILFNAQQAELLVALINAATEDTSGIPDAPAADGEYTLTVASGEAEWTEVVV